MHERGCLGVLVVKLRQKTRALARGSAQHGVDQGVATAPLELGQLHAFVHSSVICDTIQVQELQYAEAKRREDPGVKLACGTRGQALDDVIERGAPLDHAIDQGCGQRSVARL